MSNQNIEAILEQSYRNLQLLPLIKQEDLEKFWVEYCPPLVKRLRKLIKLCTSANNKIVFTGHRGCGKSTLLAELGRQLNKDYFVVVYSIADLIEGSDVNHINILFSIALQLMEEAERQKIHIPENTKKALYKWFATKSHYESSEISDELQLGFNILEWIKAQLKANAVIRDEIKIEFQRRISDLINQVNLIAATIQAGSDKEIVVIIDDLDKLDLKLVREIYCDHVKSLFQPSFRIIYTVPIAILREIDIRRILEDETSNQVEVMPVSKLYPKSEVHNPDAQPQADVINIFTKILAKRIPVTIFEAGVMQQIILKSGGVLREAIRITNECCLKASLMIDEEAENPDFKINQEILDLALSDIRNNFAEALFSTDYQMLQYVYMELKPDTPDDNQRQKFLNLLHGVYILEYRNSDLWYIVHPLVVDLLKRQELIQ